MRNLPPQRRRIAALSGALAAIAASSSILFHHHHDRALEDPLLGLVMGLTVGLAAMILFGCRHGDAR